MTYRQMSLADVCTACPRWYRSDTCWTCPALTKDRCDGPCGTCENCETRTGDWFVGCEYTQELGEKYKKWIEEHR